MASLSSSSSSSSSAASPSYDECSSLYPGDTMQIIACISDQLEIQMTDHIDNYRSWLLVVAGAFVFFMQAGFAMLCAGCVRKKNVLNTMLKNFLDVCGAAVAFYSVGYAFAFGGQGTNGNEITFVGHENFFNSGDIGHIDDAFWFFQFTFSATSVTIVAGTLAERCLMTAYILYSLFVSAFVYPVIAHALWSTNGWLSPYAANPFRGVGAIDLSGSGVIHLTGGTAALIATYILGPREGRFYDAQGKPLAKPKAMPGHSLALQVLGTMILWFGWYAFNTGSTLLLPNINDIGEIAAHVAINTSLGASAGAVSALIIKLWLVKSKTNEIHFDLTAAMNGALSGLVSITAGCATIEHYAAVLVAVMAGAIYLWGSNLLLRLRVDDAVDAIPVHLFNGVWGMIAVGLFTTPTLSREAFGRDEYVGWFYEIGRRTYSLVLLGNQILAILFIVGWVCATMIPFFLLLKYFGLFRAHIVDEMLGLDARFHRSEDVGAMDDESRSHLVAALEMQSERKRGDGGSSKKSSSNQHRNLVLDGSSETSGGTSGHV